MTEAVAAKSFSFSQAVSTVLVEEEVTQLSSKAEEHFLATEEAGATLCITLREIPYQTQQEAGVTTA
jgi:hypothetical protein